DPKLGEVISAKLRGGYLMPKISGVCVGESLVGEGNEVAHVDLLLGPRGSAAETAYCIGLTNNKDGFTTLLALVAPNLMCKQTRFYWRQCERPRPVGY